MEREIWFQDTTLRDQKVNIASIELLEAYFRYFFNGMEAYFRSLITLMLYLTWVLAWASIINWCWSAWFHNSRYILCMLAVSRRWGICCWALAIQIQSKTKWKRVLGIIINLRVTRKSWGNQRGGNKKWTEKLKNDNLQNFASNREVKICYHHLKHYLVNKHNALIMKLLNYHVTNCSLPRCRPTSNPYHARTKAYQTIRKKKERKS